IGFLPGEIVLSTVKTGLPDIIDNSNIPDEEVAELVKHYRNRDVPAIKEFFARMCTDAKREIENCAHD
ncbi:MAG: hypothetical protein IKP64_05170, partial [Selenomonadaceae bacterium]|nr:hypothetical protein [Selenomonadaceae bacterium]